MPTLSELVEFRVKLLDTVNQLTLDQEITDKKNLLMHHTDTLSGQYPIDSTVALYDELVKQSHDIIDKVRDMIKSIEHDIELLADQLASTDEYKDKFSFKNFNHSFAYDSIKDYYVPESIKESIKNVIKQYCDWHHPGLNIYPRSYEWVDCTVMCDPLYLTANCTLGTHPIIPGKPFWPDRYLPGTNLSWKKEADEWAPFTYESMMNIVGQYPEVYQRRLRLYPAKNLDFSLLPKSAFGFILSWGFANYVPKDIVKQLLEETFKLLKPGGVFMMSYNNCDLPTIAKTAEEGNLSYAHARLIRELSVEIGFDIIQFNDIETDDSYFTHVSWVELRKPGVLKTVKALQALGEIISK